MRKRSILIDLSKVFGCICPELLVAKLHGYGLSIPAAKKIEVYIANWKQRTKIGSSYCTRENSTGVPRRSILGSLFFNIFSCDLFLEHENCCYVNYADDILLQTIQQKYLRNLQILHRISLLGLPIIEWKQTMENVTFSKAKKRMLTSKYQTQQ